MGIKVPCGDLSLMSYPCGGNQDEFYRKDFKTTTNPKINELKLQIPCNAHHWLHTSFLQYCFELINC